MFVKSKVDFGQSGIYKISNVLTGQFYIGSAKCFNKRIADHNKKLKNRKHPNQYLQNVANKYGIDIFEVELIEVVEVKNLIIKEQEWLDKCFDNQNLCYNLCPNAGSRLGKKHNDKTKNKMRDAHIGKKFTDEHKQKIAIAKKKQIHIHFKKGKENPMWGKKEEHPMFGKKHTDASKQKMSISSIGKWNNKLGKKVSQYNLDGTFVRTFLSCAAAFRETNIKGIRSCANGRRKSAGGFMWSYIEQNFIGPYKRNKSTNNNSIIGIDNRKAVSQFDKISGDLIKKYTSITEASEYTGVSDVNICRCCKGKRKSAGGFVWRYN